MEAEIAAKRLLQFPEILLHDKEQLLLIYFSQVSSAL